MISSRLRILFSLIALFWILPRSAAFPEGGNSAFPFLENLRIHGSLENETGFRLHGPETFSKVQNNLELEIKDYLTDNLEFYTRDRFTYDAVYDLESTYRGRPFQEYRLNWNSKEFFEELYLEYALGNLLLTGGKQQVVWGEATGLKITDLVNPTDFREFILDDFLDSRIGLWMLKANYAFGDSQVEAVVIPDFEPNRPAVAGSQWVFALPRLLQGFTPRFHKTQRPSDGFQNSDIGLRFNTILNSWDISGYYFYAWDDNPTLHTFTHGPVKDVFPRHHRLQIGGATFNYAVGRTVLSGEFALTMGKYFQTLNPRDNDAVTRKKDIRYMLGGDYLVNDSLTASLQLIQEIILGKAKDLENDQVDTVLTLFIQTDFLNETLKPEFLIFYGVNNGDRLFRPRVAYDWNDNLKLTLGMDIFAGLKDSFFGRFDRNDRVFWEVKWSF